MSTCPRRGGTYFKICPRVQGEGGRILKFVHVSKEGGSSGISKCVHGIGITLLKKLSTLIINQVHEGRMELSFPNTIYILESLLLRTSLGCWVPGQPLTNCPVHTLPPGSGEFANPFYQCINIGLYTPIMCIYILQCTTNEIQ